MENILAVGEIKRRGMAAIEEGLLRGPVHIVKRNKPAAVVLSEDAYQALLTGRSADPVGMSAVQWLLAQTSENRRDKAEIDAALATERAW